MALAGDATVLAGLVAALLVAAAAAPLLRRVAGRATGWILALAPAGVAATLLRRAPEVVAGETPTEAFAWAPAVGVELAFRLDGLGLLMGLLVAGVGALVLVYSEGYLGDHPQVGRFQALLLAFAAAMLGLVLAGDLLVLFVFWEATGLASYLLVGFHQEKEDARGGAHAALVVTAAGGLALLAGLLLLGRVAGTYRLGPLLAQGAVVRAHALHPAIVALVAAGAMAKSAQFPFHFWLPDAMAAPTPASAYLHSATMVKAGVFLLARLFPVLGGGPVWSGILVPAGAATALLGAVLALRQADYKRVLAYATVSALGSLVLLLGLGTPAAVQAALVLLPAHALYKAALFMVAGAVDHETGTRRLDELGGLREAMPVTAAAALMAGLSLAGLAPLFSFVGKELLLEAVLDAPLARPVVLAAAVGAAVLLVAVAGIVGLSPFVGERRPTPREPHEPGPALLAGPVVLAATGLALGLRPSWAAPVVGAAAEAALGPGTGPKLTLWHGPTPALAVSVATLVAGALVYAGWLDLRPAVDRLMPLARVGPSRAYRRGLDGLRAGAKALTARLEHGSLAGYLATLLATVALLLGAALVGPAQPDLPAVAAPSMAALMATVTIAAGALVAATSSSRLPAVMGLGVAGYGVAATYLTFGAPDLAMTQILFETLTVLLFVLMARRLPPFSEETSPRRRLRDAALGLAVGGTVTWALLGAPAARRASVSAYYLRNAVPLAHGRNVVNTILVDFRALDTLGEITVIAVAAVGVAALLEVRGDTP